MQVEMRARIGAGVGICVCALLLACGGGTAPAPPAADQPAEAPERPVEVYSYPPPVSGNHDEVNLGAFDLVDGIAWRGDAGTVVWATSAAIASPGLAASACPVTLARSIALLRDARYVEVTIDAAGRSDYYAAGSQYAGTSREREAGGRNWRVDLESRDAKRIAGEVVHRERGRLRFDLPILAPEPVAMSAGDQMDHGYEAAGPLSPNEAAVVAAYVELRDAAAARDWPALLAAQGFDDDLARKIRGLPGIDDDLAAHADRFLSPGAPEETTLYATAGGVGARGTNSRGEAFFNFYQLAPCGDRLMLVGIGENPQ